MNAYAKPAKCYVSKLNQRAPVARTIRSIFNCAILAEQDEEWMTAKNYLTMKP
jgi:hypothetical protein